MNLNHDEALFALALEKPAEKRASFLKAICSGYPPCGSDRATQPIDPLGQRDDQHAAAQLFLQGGRLDLTDSKARLPNRNTILERLGKIAGMWFHSTAHRPRLWVATLCFFSSCDQNGQLIRTSGMLT